MNIYLTIVGIIGIGLSLLNLKAGIQKMLIQLDNGYEPNLHFSTLWALNTAPIIASVFIFVFWNWIFTIPILLILIHMFVFKGATFLVGFINRIIII